MTLAEIRAELRPTLALAAPLMAGQFAQMMIGLADTLMVGRVGVTPLAACAFANIVIYIPFLFGVGLLTSTAVRTSQAVGSGDAQGAAETLRHGMLLAIVFGALCMAIIIAFIPFAGLLGQPPEVVAEAGNYLVIVACSLPFALATIVLKNHCEALNRPWISFWITMGGVVLNVALNWVLIFGHLGAAALGLDGAGWATLIARAVAAACLAGVIVRMSAFASHRPPCWLRMPSAARMRDLLGLGVPSGSQLVVEVGAFAFCGVMMGWLGASPLAAHQIALTCASMTFMLPLGLGMALTLRLGQCHGAQQFHRLRVVATGAMALAAVCMCVTAALFLAFRQTIAGAFVGTDAADVLELAAQLLIIAGLFQLFDGIQVTALGGLRGLADVRWPLWTTAGCYWLISLPVAYAAAFLVGAGPVGVWFGILAGLVCAAVALSFRLWTKTYTTNFYEAR